MRSNDLYQNIFVHLNSTFPHPMGPVAALITYVEKPLFPAMHYL